jgi:hypothetical protein
MIIQEALPRREVLRLAQARPRLGKHRAKLIRIAEAPAEQLEARTHEQTLKVSRLGAARRIHADLQRLRRETHRVAIALSQHHERSQAPTTHRVLALLPRKRLDAQRLRAGKLRRQRAGELGVILIHNADRHRAPPAIARAARQRSKEHREEHRKPQNPEHAELVARHHPQVLQRDREHAAHHSRSFRPVSVRKTDSRSGR